ncbi:hypothetical protein VTO73DRAFT_2866 [Trametes versicolor]
MTIERPKPRLHVRPLLPTTLALFPRRISAYIRIAFVLASLAPCHPTLPQLLCSPAIETARSPLYCSLSVVLVTFRYLAAALAAHYLCIYRIDLHCHPSIFRPHPSIAALSLVTARYIHTPHHPHPSTAISINIYSTSAHAHPPALTHLHTALIVKIAFDRTYKSSPFHAPLTPLGYHPLHKYTCSPSPVARATPHALRVRICTCFVCSPFARVCNVMGFICRPPCVPFSSLNVRSFLDRASPTPSPLLAFRLAVAVPAAVALRASPPALASLAFLATTH